MHASRSFPSTKQIPSLQTAYLGTYAKRLSKAGNSTPYAHFCQELLLRRKVNLPNQEGLQQTVESSSFSVKKKSPQAHFRCCQGFLRFNMPKREGV
jgi:hypothetical protein